MAIPERTAGANSPNPCELWLAIWASEVRSWVPLAAAKPEVARHHVSADFRLVIAGDSGLLGPVSCLY